MSGVEERLAEYLKYKGIKFGTAEKACGMSNGLLGKAVMKNTHLGSDKIENILRAYQDLSAEWLMRGTGPMLLANKYDPRQVFEALGMPADSDKIVATWMKMMECNKEMIALFGTMKSVQKTCDYENTQPHNSDKQ